MNSHENKTSQGQARLAKAQQLQVKPCVFLCNGLLCYNRLLLAIACATSCHLKASCPSSTMGVLRMGSGLFHQKGTTRMMASTLLCVASPTSSLQGPSLTSYSACRKQNTQTPESGFGRTAWLQSFCLFLQWPLNQDPCATIPSCLSETKEHVSSNACGGIKCAMQHSYSICLAGAHHQTRSTETVLFSISQLGRASGNIKRSYTGKDHKVPQDCSLRKTYFVLTT